MKEFGKKLVSNEFAEEVSKPKPALPPSLEILLWRRRRLEATTLIIREGMSTRWHLLTSPPAKKGSDRHPKTSIDSKMAATPKRQAQRREKPSDLKDGASWALRPLSQSRRAMDSGRVKEDPTGS